MCCGFQDHFGQPSNLSALLSVDPAWEDVDPSFRFRVRGRKPYRKGGCPTALVVGGWNPLVTIGWSVSYSPSGTPRRRNLWNRWDGRCCGGCRGGGDGPEVSAEEAGGRLGSWPIGEG